MPRISSPRPLDLTKPFVTSSQSYGSQPFDLSQNLVTWYRDVQGDFVPDLSGRGNTARCAGSGSFLPVVTSIDSPEFNYSRFDVRSFSFGGGSSGTEYPHIKTVSSTNAPFASDDHSFTDGTKDLPFSISFWIKPQATSAQQYIVSKINSAAALSGYEWSIEINGKTLKTILNGTGAASKYLQWERVGDISAGDWFHVVATYNGSESVTGINMYLNGGVISPSSLTSNAYTGMSKTSTPICIGNKFNSTSFAAVSSEEYDGLIHSVAIWKNRALTAAEINALHKAYINGPGGEARSGFISRSPRLMLRELDDLPGSYSTVRRTGDPTRAGALSSNFNDETGIVFSQSGEVVFPSMLPKGSSFSSQAVDIIGQESDVSASLPIRSFQQPNHLHYSPVEEMGPFDENRVIPATDFFLSGTDPDVLPGFTSPVRSKIAIEIDITPGNSAKVMRNVDRVSVGEGGASIGDQTGFLYYNFARKEWEQIGLQDPATGGTLYYDYAIDPFPDSQMSGTFPMQFGPVWPHSDQTKAVRESFGYKKIGTPTISLQAPFKEVYHATASQALKLRDYISEPFLLEKVTVQFSEIQAQRTQGNLPSIYTSSGSNRDIDNYVFFAYRQSHKNHLVDSISDVSSSQRYIVFSGSMTFWNSASFIASSNDEAVLSHTPAFSYNFGLPFDNVYRVGQFTGSVSLEITPAVAQRQSFSNSYLWWKDNALSQAKFGGIRNFWCGGTSCQKFEPRWAERWFALTDPVAVDNDNRFLLNPDFDIVSPDLDGRAFRKFGGEVNAPVFADVDTFTETFVINENFQSIESPYLLMPDDEIVFGMDCGVMPFGGAKTFSSITGSQLTIAPKPCKVTFHGSLISNFKEYLPSLNQDLSSNSVHEIIGAEPQLDQFQIEPISSYYGSYLDEIVTGSMTTPALGGIIFTTRDQDNSRRVISHVSLGQAGTTGSLQRFVKISDASERAYDSCLPDIFTFISQSNIGLTGSIAKVGQNTFNDSLNEYTTFLPQQFPFKDDPTRFFEPEGDLQSIDSNSTIATDQVLAYRNLSDAATGGGLGAGYASDARMRDLVFRTGWKVSKRLAGNDGLAHRMQNQTSAGVSQRPFSSGTFRYGISSVEPEFTSSRWRYDHYGYFRDMLEPRRNIVTYDGLKTVKISFMSGSTKVDSMLTHTQNLSTFATSSMPYFDDGVARNRPDNPDESLVEVIA
jgi:hypothetical protein